MTAYRILVKDSGHGLLHEAAEAPKLLSGDGGVEGGDLGQGETLEGAWPDVSV